MTGNDDYYDPRDAEADLDALQGDFQNAEPPPQEDFDVVPDGRYQVVVDAVELKRSKNNNPMLSWTLKILGPRCAGRKLFTRNMLMTSTNLAYLKKNLGICGLVLENLRDLAREEVLTQLLDVQLEVGKKTKDRSQPENYDIFFNKRINVGQGAPAAGAEGDVPF